VMDQAMAQRHTAGDRAGPDAAGVTRNEKAPMRQEPLDITAVLFGDVRAGRAAARSVVLGLKWSLETAEA
jgi:hypothetical protein